MIGIFFFLRLTAIFQISGREVTGSSKVFVTAKMSKSPGTGVGWGASSVPSKILPRYLAFHVVSATLARLDDHVGELLHYGGPSGVVEYSEGLQVFRDAAGGGRGLRIQSVVQAQQLLWGAHRGGRVKSLSREAGCPLRGNTKLEPRTNQTRGVCPPSGLLTELCVVSELLR